MTYRSSFAGLRRSGIIGLSLGTALLVGCSTVTEPFSQTAPSADSNELATESLGRTADRAMLDDGSQKAALSGPSPDLPTASVASQPQLRKQVNLTVVLTDLDTAANQVQQRITQAQGNLLGLEDDRAPDGMAHQITLTLRVPQTQLDTVLADFRALGTVQQQSITAEDVSDQLVDLEARLKNLRQSETALLEIMERSGDIADVLEVSRELSHVRETIERMAAQQQSLKRQVDYSYIYLTLKSPTSAVAPLRPAGETLGNTWQAATHSVKTFTLEGLKMSLWLLAYSPYIAMIAILSFGISKLRHPRPVTPSNGESEPG
jgi:hypothetical protein